MGNCWDCRGGRRDHEVGALARLLASAALAAGVSGCFGPGAVPISDRATEPRYPVNAVTEYRIVRSGDTLYSIAFERGIDYRELAAWNGIAAPYLIKPGQRLRLTAPPHTPRAVAKPPPAPAAPAPQAPPRTARATPSPAPWTDSPPVRTPHFEVSKSGWIWPTDGTIIRSFSTRRGNKGIDIAGRAGQSVRAAAPGRVVYAGSGLRGYGKLIIVKHNETFLSAYAHNRKMLVSEGSIVTRGQPIGEMGRSGNSERVKLHFEIRRRGVPVNPLRYLPRR